MRRDGGDSTGVIGRGMLSKGLGRDLGEPMFSLISRRDCSILICGLYGSPLTKTQPFGVRSGASKREKNKPLQIKRLNREIRVLKAKETEVRGWGIGSRIDP